MTTNMDLPPVNPYETPMEVHRQSSRRSVSVLRWERFQVLGVGIIVGMLIAIPFVTEPEPSGFQFAQWASIMTGPLMAIVHGVEVPALVGLIGCLMAVSHPVMPRSWTAWLTIVGLLLWFWSGCVGLSL